jgi:hypothetical protein
VFSFRRHHDSINVPIFVLVVAQVQDGELLWTLGQYNSLYQQLHLHAFWPHWGVWQKTRDP